MTIKCKYPIGIQTFSRIISEGYIYVDKTDFVWKLVLKAFLQQEVTSFWFEGSDMQAGFALKFWRALKKGDADTRTPTAWMADTMVPVCL